MRTPLLKDEESTRRVFLLSISFPFFFFHLRLKPSSKNDYLCISYARSSRSHAAFCFLNVAFALISSQRAG
jgi:hypothetical protein